MKFTKPKVEGDVFAQPDSLLNPSKGVSKSKDYASAALNNALTNQNEDLDGYKLASAIKSTDPNSTTANYGGSSGVYDTQGSLLNKAQEEFFRNQNLDIMKA